MNNDLLIVYRIVALNKQGSSKGILCSKDNSKRNPVLNKEDKI